MQLPRHSDHVEIGAADDQDAIRELFGSEVSVASSPIVYSLYELLPEECDFVTHASPKRQREFATGRVLARKLLVGLGFTSAPLQISVDESPAWPHGIVGSISHSDSLCAVSIALRTQLASIGLDIEQLGVVPERLLDIIARKDEMAWIDSGDVADRHGRARLLFSVKECFYKCQHTFTLAKLDYEDIKVIFDESKSTFEVWVCRSTPDTWLPRLNGRFQFTASHVFTGMAVRCDQASLRPSKCNDD